MEEFCKKKTNAEETELPEKVHVFHACTCFRSYPEIAIINISSVQLQRSPSRDNSVVIISQLKAVESDEEQVLDEVRSEMEGMGLKT